MEQIKTLVVDDEPGIRLSVARVLEDFSVQVHELDRQVGFAVRQAESGEQALEEIERDPPELILLDHKLPGISGLDVLERLNHEHPRILTVMITAYASIETAVTATRRGAFDFVAKPFTPEELRGVARKAAARVVIARQARRLEEEKRKVRFQFISVLAHELKSPLNAIENYLNIMADPGAAVPDPEVQQHMIGRSLTRIEGMRKLIADLLDLTRIESGEKQRELTRVDLAEVARHVLENHTAEAQARGIEQALDGPDALPIEADRGELEIILNNLVSNALKYNREGGRVDVRLERLGGAGARLSVEDTGIGMTPEESARLFADFVRIRNEQTRDIPGSGLGLSIVRKLAHLYGGEAGVRSEPGRGSCFHVDLPGEVDRGKT